MVKRQRIIGSILRSRSVAEKSAIIAQFKKDAVPLFAAGTIEPLIDARFSLKDTAEAHRMLERSDHFGKIVLQNRESSLEQLNDRAVPVA